MVRIPFSRRGKEGGLTGSIELPVTLAKDPQRRSVISYYVADSQPLDAVRDALQAKYSGMTDEHLDSVVQAIGKKREVRAKRDR